MDVTLEIADLRAEAESMMTDLVQITRFGMPMEPPAFDPVTGMYPPVDRQVVYSGKASLRVPGTVSTGKERPSAGDSASILIAILAIPFDAPRLLINDLATFAASTFNPVLVGLSYTVSSLLPSSHVTKQRATVELVVD